MGKTETNEKNEHCSLYKGDIIADGKFRYNCIFFYESNNQLRFNSWELKMADYDVYHFPYRQSNPLKAVSISPTWQCGNKSGNERLLI